MMPAGVPHVIKTLQMRFGRPELIIHFLLDRVRHVPAPKPERLDTLIDFGLAVENLVVHLQAAKQENHLTNPVLLQELVMKLPAQLRLDWARYKLIHQDPTLAAFGTFMNELIQAASEVSFELPISEIREAKRQRKSFCTCSRLPRYGNQTYRCSEEVSQAMYCMQCSRAPYCGM